MKPEINSVITDTLREKAIEAKRLDFEARAKRGEFCAYDRVSIKHSFWSLVPKMVGKEIDWDAEQPVTINRVWVLDGVKFATIQFELQGGVWGKFTYIYHIPMRYLTGKWEDNEKGLG